MTTDTATDTATDTGTGTGTVEQVDDLDYAREAMKATLDRAQKARKSRRKAQATSVTIPVDAPYAKEWRLICGLIAQRHNVFAVGTPRGSVRAGYTVTLFGFTPDIKKAQAEWAQVREHADAAMKQAQPREGEDVATFRSSFLLGYRLAMTGFDAGDSDGDSDERAAVEETIAARVVSTPRNVQARSTGSGAYAGFVAARTAAVDAAA